MRRLTGDPGSRCDNSFPSVPSSATACVWLQAPDSCEPLAANQNVENMSRKGVSYKTDARLAYGGETPATIHVREWACPRHDSTEANGWRRR